MSKGFQLSKLCCQIWAYSPLYCLISKFIIECKRLQNASQKYIDEGLRRFIDKEYSANENYASMIGFVINDNIEKICVSLSGKCKTENYINSDFVRQKYTGWKHNFKTTHSRENSKKINIYHLFFDFKQNWKLTHIIVESDNKFLKIEDCEEIPL